MADFDLIAIGAGNAGMAAVSAAAAAGWRVAIVEAGVLGGTCPNRGCVPKKVLVAAAEVVDAARRASGRGVVGDVRIDWAALQAARHAIVDPIPASMAATLDSEGVELVHGRARFTGPGSLDVDGRALRARKIVIATGSSPRPLAVAGAERLATSTEVLALDRVPRTAAFIGAGVIAFELSHVLARAGCTRIVLLEPGRHALGRCDADAVAALVAYSKVLGIEVELGAAVESIDWSPDGSAVIRYGNAELAVDLAVHGAGHVPSLGGLALDRAGLSGRVGADLRCVEDPNVAIVGDAASELPQLSPLATSLGRLVAENFVHDRHVAPDLRAVPSCVFSIPTLAQVGLTEAAARASGVSFRAVVTPNMTSWISARTHHEQVAFSKILLAPDGQILGAHLLGHGAESNIHLFALAMRNHLPASELLAFDTAYPTYPADLKFLLG